MLRDEHGLKFPYQLLQLAQMVSAQRVSGTNRQPDAVQTQGVVSTDQCQVLTVCAAMRKVILAVGFEPADGWAVRGDFLVMLGTQADSRRQRRLARPNPLPRSRGEGWCKRRMGEAHPARLYLPGVSEPPTIRSQVPFGNLMNSLALPFLAL